ncbi:Dynamin central region-domain-containing protein [Tribonema minus]|uniref:Dynamin central region-domain-containing protein n=1 Tax=Tribonema minus TaxID=303371 RepID=A0A836CKP3_9STRA|nr:Dynamin central region-domain-containing protein [Tribonema minus]
MDELIPIVNKLQDVFSAIGQPPIDLPQIVVIGSQSSGKSSVLENIVGRDFLPRGTGIVTRRPLVLQLYNTGGAAGHVKRESTPAASPTEPGSPTAKRAVPAVPQREWGEFLHLPNQKFYNFTEIREEIVRETDRLTGRNKGISSQSINLRIFSPHVLNLTLVDLPGITKVALGDQPQDIEEQIRDMCMRYIHNPNAIILSVTPANSDLVNSDALKMAREVDMEGDRTIGVLTKLDLMDPGTDAADILNNHVIPLKRGYVGVINRGQKDIDGGVSIRQALAKEALFVKEHAAYRSLQHKVGTATLAKQLNQVLMRHIRDCLPEIKSKLNMMMLSVQQEMAELGEPTDAASVNNLGATLLTLLSKFATNFQAAVDGRGSSPDGIEMNELYGGARISYVFHEVFARSLEGVNPFDGLADEDIRTAICNANGTRPSLFVPEMSFDLLVRKQIARLEQPGLQCADLVFDEMQRIAAQCETMELSRFPLLRERVVEVVHGLLRKCLGPSQVMISNLVKLELAYINTSHPDFIGGSRAVAQLMDKTNNSHQQHHHSSSAGASAPAARSTSEPPPKTAPARPSSSGADGGRNWRDESRAGASPATSSASGNGASNKGGLMSFMFGNKGQPTQSAMTPAGAPMVKLPQVPETMRQSKEPTDRERVETEIIKSLMESYFDIVRKNFQDMVPKAIMHFLVNEVIQSMQNQLVSSLYREELIAELMRETEDVAERRRIAREMFELLHRAMAILNEVRDFNTHKV